MAAELLAAADIAKLAGVSRQRAHVLGRRPDFPQPAAVTSLGPFWDRSEVERWLRTWDRRPGKKGGSES